MQMLTKICRKSKSGPIVQLWKHCYRRNKPETRQSNAPRWTFSFISANW